MHTTTSVRNEVEAARQRVERDRAGALAALNGLFRRGVVPNPPLDGRYQGALITPSLNPLLDAMGRALTSRWLPWKGKTFDAASQTGDNMFTNDGLPVARLIWPLYRGYAPDGPGRSRACQFRTYIGPGKLDPDREVLKIDYDWDVNPRFILRSVLDELVQIDDGYYLGKALLRFGRRYICAAYFTLSSS
jgi:hypothetical protein